MSEYKYTEQSIQQRLSGFFASGSIKYDVDNLYVFSWESDKLLWTKSGYIYEFEIKISRADFKNDFKHKIAKHALLASIWPKELPLIHDLFDSYQKVRKEKYGRYITDGDIEQEFERLCDFSRRKMPNFFYYAVPKGMIDVDEVPEYAGLIWIDEGLLYIKKKAPCLHKEKYTDEQLKLGEKFYYNWESTKRTLRRAEKDVAYYKTQLDMELAAKGRELTYDELMTKLANARKAADTYREESAVNQKLYLTMVEGADYNTIERHMLIDKIKEFDPKFDYLAFIKDVDKKYEERYPNRK
jgi:hypothetical protein